MPPIISQLSGFSTRRPSFYLVIRTIIVTNLLCGIMLLPAQAWTGQEKRVDTLVDVPAAKWRGIRLNGLVGEARLRVLVDSDGPIKIGVYTADSFQQLPDAKAMIGGETVDALEFTTLIPKKGTYYLLVDNRAGVEARQVSVNIVASTNAPRIANPSAVGSSVLEALDLFEAALTKTFIIESFRVDILRCDKANAYAAIGQIIVCDEYLEKLREDFDGDNNSLSDLLLFTLMHEAGHVLLHDWQFPEREDEALIDEFATVLMIMFGQIHRLDSTIAYFDKRESTTTTLLRSIFTSKGSHPGSGQRATNIRNWKNDRTVMKSWQKIVIPRMRSNVLQDLLNKPRAWANTEFIKNELLLRCQTESLLVCDDKLSRP